MHFAWEWLSPGGLPGLQNLWRVALRVAVGSTPIHSRLLYLKTLKVFLIHMEEDPSELTIRH
jgi:hypothetical protein